MDIFPLVTGYCCGGVLMHPKSNVISADQTTVVVEILCFVWKN